MDEAKLEIGPDEPEVLNRRLYFINECVEELLRYYLWTSCVDVALRDAIMAHAPELIRQIIRKQHLHIIYTGQDEASFNDLEHIGWCQVERTLYKFRARPHCRACYSPDRPLDSALYLPADTEYGIITYKQLFKHLGKRKCPHCGALLSDKPVVHAKQGTFSGSQSILFRGNSKLFNLWSQVSRTVILAFVKKEGRDRKNSSSYKGHLSGTQKVDEDRLKRFFAEAREICKHNSDHARCLEALSRVVTTDERPYDGLINKLTKESGLSRVQVNTFLKMIRLRGHDFTDSPLNREGVVGDRTVFKLTDDE